MTKRIVEYQVIPSDANVEFVAIMEEVLETDAKQRSVAWQFKSTMPAPQKKSSGSTQ